jgi:hypothetical protein
MAPTLVSSGLSRFAIRHGAFVVYVASEESKNPGQGMDIGRTDVAR